MNKKVIKLLLALSLVPIKVFSSTPTSKIIGGRACKRVNYNPIFETGTFGTITNNSSFNYMLNDCAIHARQKNDLAETCNLKHASFKQLMYNNTIILSAQKTATGHSEPDIKMTFIDAPPTRIIIDNTNFQSNKTSRITVDLGQLKISPPLITLDPNKMQPSSVLDDQNTFNETKKFITKNPSTTILNNFGILQWFLDLTIKADQTIEIDRLRLRLQYTADIKSRCQKRKFTYVLTKNDLRNYKISY